MHKIARSLCAVAAALPTACATPGGGQFGMVLFDPKHHVSAAEPLFGDNDERCLDDPTFMLTLFAPLPDAQAKVDPCTRMKRAIAWGLLSHGVSVNGYNERARNEVVDALMAASDRKCGRYIAFLQQYDGNVNSTFGIGAQTAAILATVVSASAAPWFAAGAGIAGGTRGTLNEAHFNNQTIGVLANAFENVRRDQRVAIAELEAKPVKDYSLMRGIEDATRYHASCTIVVGLKEAQRDVEAARSPNLDTYKAMIKNLKEIQSGIADLQKKVPAPIGDDNTADNAADSNAAENAVDSNSVDNAVNNAESLLPPVQNEQRNETLPNTAPPIPG
jgi:hypothetical protein